MSPVVLDEVRVEVNDGRRGAKASAFVYVNEGYNGSTANIAAGNRTNTNTNTNTTELNAGVYREQYCVCARWPYSQRVLAITVGVLLGALIGLSISIAFRDKGDPVIGPIF